MDTRSTFSSWSAAHLAPRAGVVAWSRALHVAMRRLRSSLTGFDAALVHEELVALAGQPFLDAAEIPWVLVLHGENRNPAMSRTSDRRAKDLRGSQGREPNISC